MYYYCYDYTLLLLVIGIFIIIIIITVIAIAIISFISHVPTGDGCLEKLNLSYDVIVANHLSHQVIVDDASAPSDAKDAQQW